MHALLLPWIDALGHDEEVVRAGRDVVARYEQPSRRYHDVRHLAELLEALRVLHPDDVPPATVVCAAYWHDAVYDPTSTDNEERSAAEARRCLLALGRPGPFCDEVVRLVRLTADHDPDPGDPDGVLLSDADLSVLAAAPERYLAYAADVRAEYAHLPEDVFRRGRHDVLRALVDRPSVYRGAAARARWERAAHRNVRAELSGLEAGGGAAPLP